MTDDINYRVREWQAPARPEWVQRINAEGACLDLKSVIPLDEDSLISRAKANTDLSDFGSDDWYEPFKVFIKALDEESDLNLMGRLMTRSDILMHLQARLQIEDTYKRHPDIDDQQLSPVIMIVGSGRSGTSAIQNLLSLDPDNGTPKTWEALFPCPPPEAKTYHIDPRIGIAHQRIDQWNRVTPEIVAMHEFAGDMPTELIQLETLAFQNGGWLDLYGLVPSFDGYLRAANYEHSLRYAKRVLKLLQWKNPRERWLLKSPDCMRYMPQLFKVFPDTQLVWMHRDPIKCVSSMVSLIGTLFWIRSDRPLSEQAIAQLTNPAGLASHFDRVMDQIDQGLIPQSQLRSVQYLDFVNDALDTVEKLYRGMGLELTGRAKDAMQRYMREHPREQRPAHKYSSGDAARQQDERKLFERYQTRFNVESEA